mgnify:CR=1 FL=1
MACAILPERFGVIPSPMDLQLIESKSTISDDKNKVEQAVDNYYGEAGVSKALISSASSGSELKLSMKVDSSDIYRIYLPPNLSERIAQAISTNLLINSSPIDI